ncbi:MAG: class I SAM-dependent methyltransferase [Polyangiaceae bacterium]
MTAPSTSNEFDRVYRGLFTPWGDVRIPLELKQLLSTEQPQSSLELGCGLGRFSLHLAERGVAATAVDFSAVAIERARQRAASHARRPEFLVGDVTNLNALNGPFDVSFDVGCFHCLGAEQQLAYAAEVARLLRPNGTHLLWALDVAPCALRLSPASVAQAFAPYFELREARKSRRRLASSHWYWLVRRA